METQERAPQGGGCLKAAGIGCGCLAVLLLLAAGLIAINWTKISALWSEGTAPVTELTRVQSAVRARHGFDQVNVMTKYRTGSETILSIEVVNAPGLDTLDNDALRVRALEIAATARDTLRSPDAYRRFEVKFSRKSGFGVKMSTSRFFLLDAGELPPARTGRAGE
jgi:hypothetical protein